MERKRKFFISSATALAMVALTTPAGASTYCIGTDGKAAYNTDEKRTYEYKSAAGQWKGTWEGSPGKGKVTVRFDNGVRRTDTYKVMDGQLYLVNSAGTALPARLHSLKRPC